MTQPQTEERDREQLLGEFLKGCGWGDAHREPIPGDASFRRYERLRDPDTGRTTVLMNSPPRAAEDQASFAGLAVHLRSLGLSAPEILEGNLADGFMLIEDLGGPDFARGLVEDPGPERDWYFAAVDLLAVLAGALPPREVAFAGARRTVGAFDHGVLWQEAALLIEWWLPAATGVETSPDLTEEYAGIIRETCAEVADCTSCLVLRDYHAENLIWLPGRSGVARVGLLDFQDGLAGHPAYDLMSLLEDARRDTSDQLRSDCYERFLQGSGTLIEDRDAFDYAYCALGAQRQLKIVGIFARLWLRDAKPGYFDYLPRVWEHLQRDLAHPRLSKLRRWIKNHVPPPEPGIVERIRAARIES